MINNERGTFIINNKTLIYVKKYILITTLNKKINKNNKITIKFIIKLN